MWKVPAEIVIEKAKYGGWMWFICQPDQAWGVWEQCKHKYADNKDCFRDAEAALCRVYIEQGF